jgi:hypothetical protein
VTPALLVETLQARGVVLWAVGDRLRVRPATAVTPEELEALRRHKAEIMKLLAPAPDVPTPPDLALLWEARYRALLRHAFRLVSEGGSADPVGCARTLDEVAVLTDELGPDRAQHVRREEARQWWQETARCPWCGEAGRYHDPERSAGDGGEQGRLFA